MQAKETTWARWNAAWWDKQGPRAGVAAAVPATVLGTILTSTSIDGLAAIWPLRIAASLLLGTAVLEADAAFGPAVVTGTIVHLALSAFFGLTFAAIMARCRPMRQSLAVAGAAGMLYGLLIWLVNVYAIAPVYGWTWIPEVTDPLALAIAHAFGFGLPLAGYLYLAAAPRRRSGID
jgi:hypothetical protein